MLHFKIWWPLNKVYTIHEVEKNLKLIKYVFRAMDHKTNPIPCTHCKIKPKKKKMMVATQMKMMMVR
jgi:hypothetical protein